MGVDDVYVCDITYAHVYMYPYLVTRSVCRYGHIITCIRLVTRSVCRCVYMYPYLVTLTRMSTCIPTVSRAYVTHVYMYPSCHAHVYMYPYGVGVDDVYVIAHTSRMCTTECADISR